MNHILFPWQYCPARHFMAASRAISCCLLLRSAWLLLPFLPLCLNCLLTSDRLKIIHYLSNAKFSTTSIQGQIKGKQQICQYLLSGLPKKYSYIFLSALKPGRLIFYDLMVVYLIASNITDNSANSVNEQEF